MNDNIQFQKKEYISIPHISGRLYGKIDHFNPAECTTPILHYIYTLVPPVFFNSMILNHF